MVTVERITDAITSQGDAGVSERKNSNLQYCVEVQGKRYVRTTSFAQDGSAQRQNLSADGRKSILSLLHRTSVELRDFVTKYL